MACLVGALAGIVSARPPAPIVAERSIVKDGLGPVSFVVQVSFADKSADHISISVSGTNNTGVHLRRVLFCVNLESATCSARFWTQAGWRAGASQTWSVNVTGKAVGLNSTRASDIRAAGIQVIIRDFEQDHFAGVRKIYVEKIEGGFGNLNDLVREQVMAAVVNSGGRFQLVDEFVRADAIIRGRAERRERGTAVQSSGQEQSLNRTSGIAGGFGGGAAGTVYGVVAGRGKSSGSVASEKTERTELLFSEFVVLRLTTVISGESIWAWDDTKACRGSSHPKCAVDDLVQAAAIPASLDGH